MNKQQYTALVEKRAARSPVLKNTAAAFLVGGSICMLGEAFRRAALLFGVAAENAPSVTAIALIFLAALTSGIGCFDRLARIAGAGTLVPVTGFANAVVSPALDTKNEGLVLGIGAKIFTVAGPVLLFAVLSGAVYGTILLFMGWLF